MIYNTTVNWLKVELIIKTTSIPSFQYSPLFLQVPVGRNIFFSYKTKVVYKIRLEFRMICNFTKGDWNSRYTELCDPILHGYVNNKELLLISHLVDSSCV